MGKKENSHYELRPTSEHDVGLFYALSEEEDEVLGAIGHVRIDFGTSGKEWWSTWHPRGSQELNDKPFQDELCALVNSLRKPGGLLHSRTDMKQYCLEHGGAIEGGWTQSYGYEVETEKYLFRIRCIPEPGDYNCYLNCFDKKQQEMMECKQPVGRVTYANGEEMKFRDTNRFLKTIEEELPFRDTTGFRYEILSDDPNLKKQVDDQLYNLIGECNPRQTYQNEASQPNEEIGMKM